MIESYIRTKRKPPQGTPCDMSVGVDYSSKQPHVVNCKNAATAELRGGALPFETWVCEEHAKKLEAAAAIRALKGVKP